jgi:hypothetical protein
MKFYAVSRVRFTQQREEAKFAVYANSLEEAKNLARLRNEASFDWLVTDKEVVTDFPDIVSEKGF